MGRCGVSQQEDVCWKGLTVARFVVGDLGQFNKVAFFYDLDAVGMSGNSMSEHLNFDLDAIQNGIKLTL